MSACATPAPYYVPTTPRSQCVNNCSLVPPYRYLTESRCDDKCVSPAAYPEDISAGICSLSCRYYTVNGNRYCMT